MFNEKKNEENVVHIHTTEYLSCSLKKKRSPVPCNNMDKLGGYCAKWKKPVTVEQMLHNSIYKKYLK